MQKKLIALAVGATIVAAPMFAQADVKLKGRIEVELANTDGGDIDSVTRQGDYNGLSRWLIDVDKDLGNGLKAIGRMSWAFQPSDNTTQTARDQYVGLAGGWGAFVAGRLPTPYKMNGGVKWDPYTATFMQARRAGGMSGDALGHNSFVNDVLAYVMPELGGINATFAYIGSKDDGLNGTYTLGGTGKWGPVEVIAAYTDASVSGDADNHKTHLKQGKAGVRYNANGLTAAYQFESVDTGGAIKVNGLAVGAAGKGKFNFVNLGYKFGNTLVAGNWGKFSADDEGAKDVDYLALGVTYFFDKKVRVYGGWANTDTNSTTAAGNSTSYDTFGAGIRYDF